MGKNRLLLGSVAFGVSFGLSLLVNRDIKTALSTGLITVPATFLGVVAGNRKQRTERKPTLNALQTQVHQLERREKELNQSLSAIAAKKQETENSVNYWQAELIRLQNQVAEQQSNKDKIEQILIKFNENEADEKLPEEWTEFMSQLPTYEFQVLKALVEQGNPRAKITKIAEENITMPEVLIELINERALNTIGNLLVAPGNGLFPPVIPEEHLTNVKKVIKIKK